MELFEHVAKPLVADLIHGRNGESTDELQKEDTFFFKPQQLSYGLICLLNFSNSAAFHPTKLFCILTLSGTKRFNFEVIIGS